jgi:hypothetical protein
MSQRRSPVCDPVRACAVIWFVSGYSATSGDRSVEAIRYRTGSSVSFERPCAPSGPVGSGLLRPPRAAECRHSFEALDVLAAQPAAPRSHGGSEMEPNCPALARRRSLPGHHRAAIASNGSRLRASPLPVPILRSRCFVAHATEATTRSRVLSEARDSPGPGCGNVTRQLSASALSQAVAA